MKVCVIQPPYSADYSKSEECFNTQLELLKKCDSSIDVIVLPESADIPSLAKTQEQRSESIAKYNKKILDEASAAAKRCDAVVFVNAWYKAEKGYRNTTYAFRRDGVVAGLYFKEHPVASEVAQPERDSQYSFEHTEPTVVEIDGIRYGF